MQERVWVTRSLAILMRHGRTLVYRIAFLLFVVLILLAFRLKMLHGQPPSFTDQENPASFSDHFITRFLTYSYLCVFNFWLLLAPVTLSYDWALGSIPLVESIMDVRNLATFVFFSSLVGLAIQSVRVKSSSARVLTIGLSLIIIPFLPASNLFFKVGFVIAERVLYIPSLGFCIIVVYGASCMSDIIAKWRATKQAIMVSLCVVIILFSWRTVARNIVWQDRESLFKYGLNAVPANAKVHYNYANYLKDVGRSKEAVERFRRAIQLYPRHASACNNLGTLVDNETESESLYRQAIEINPYHPRAHFNLGNLMSQQGKKAEAERFLRESVRLDPSHVDGWLNIASLLADEEKFEEALTVMKHAIELKPDRADTYNNMGAHLTKMGKPQEALAYYDKALSLNPSLSIAMVNKARILRTLGNSKEAEQLYKRALSIQRSADTLHYLGSMYYNTERLSEAEEAFRQALEIDSKRLESMQNYAQTLVQLGRKDDAVEVLRRGMVAYPQNVEMRTHLSSLLASNKQFEEALEVLDGADKSNSEVWFAKGNILRDLNRLDDAAQAYSQSVTLNSRHSSARMNLGAIYHLQKRFFEAKREYELALEMDPNNKILGTNIEKLNREMQKSRRNR
ncbi:protein O-mannosyl-transferase TMTC1-like isoform X2 [Corticium candelabrum]|uniref:protein O-mannosyl-transferase TMTC1-like isoform X2 n=1 Tax=Corticium candelabrum TaxID=121492 RepID=UPI002E26AB73|nr:protein O-mannosyl-transferase TMTC1-like isoform X2 [Corticium candelabrum]